MGGGGWRTELRFARHLLPAPGAAAREDRRGGGGGGGVASAVNGPVKGRVKQRLMGSDV